MLSELLDVTKNSHTASDEQLAREAQQAGCMAPFETLVHRYEERIFAFLKCRVDCMQDAQDLTQGVFVQAYRKIRKFNPRYPFASWLFTIARRMSISHYRKACILDVPALPGELFDGNNPGREAAWNDAREKLWGVARGLLPESQFAALYLRAAEQMSIMDIAHALQKSPSHVKVLLHRARRNMVQQLAEGNEELNAVRDTAREAPTAALIGVAPAESQY